MFTSKDLQRKQVLIVLTALIIFEVFGIAYCFSLNFDDYITVVVILLALPLAYFGYLYLREACSEARDRERLSGQAYRRTEGPGKETEREVGRLIDSEEYKEFEARRGRQEQEREQSEEQKAQKAEQDEVLAELQSKEEEIFSQ